MKSRSLLLYLEDMIGYAEKAMAFVEGFTEKTFLDDDRTVFAVVRCFEVIGEAAKHISKEYQDRFPDIPWRHVVSFRNYLIHEYLGVKMDRVWISTTIDLPKTLPLFKSMYSILKDEES